MATHARFYSRFTQLSLRWPRSPRCRRADGSPAAPPGHGERDGQFSDRQVSGLRSPLGVVVLVMCPLSLLINSSSSSL